MTLRPSVVVVPLGRSLVLADEARRSGTPTYLLSTGLLPSKEEFFERACDLLPLDPPLRGPDRWGALERSLQVGLARLGARRVVLVWPDAHRMSRDVPEDYRTALSMLTSLAESLVRVGGPQLDVILGSEP